MKVILCREVVVVQSRIDLDMRGEQMLQRRLRVKGKGSRYRDWYRSDRNKNLLWISENM